MSHYLFFQSVSRSVALQQQCIDGQSNWRIASGIEPLESTAAIEWTGTLPSSIITTIHRNHTVVFVGTADGDLVKVWMSLFIFLLIFLHQGMKIIDENFDF